MPGTRPNILLITTDQHHYRALGAHDPVLRTPTLDRLAAEGMLFNRAYCTNPTCTPSRASIVTGLYPSTHGAWSLGTKLAEDVPTMGTLFSSAGYSTTLIGKAHFQPLGSTPEQTSIENPALIRNLDYWRTFDGPFYGFDRVELARGHGDEYFVGMHYGLWLEKNGVPGWRDYFTRADPDRPNAPKRRHVWDLPAEHHYTTWTAERSIAAIEESVAADKPFLCWASFHDPHPPYLVPQPWAQMYDPADMQPGHLEPGELDAMPIWHQMTQQAQPDFGPWQETGYTNHGFGSQVVDDPTLRANMAVYYGMISFVDDQVGRILDRLESLGVADNTIVVFTTDHGHFLGQHGLTAKGPFHYEDLLRIPFIVRWPGNTPTGTSSDALVSLVDLAPTFLRAAGQDVPGVMQGVDQTPVWRGAVERVRDHVIAENRHQPTAVHLRTYIDQRHKMTLYRDRPWGELFDLAEDPDERRNLFDKPECAGLRSNLMHRFLNAEMVREPTRFNRIANA